MVWVVRVMRMVRVVRMVAVRGVAVAAWTAVPLAAATTRASAITITAQSTSTLQTAQRAFKYVRTIAGILVCFERVHVFADGHGEAAAAVIADKERLSVSDTAVSTAIALHKLQSFAPTPRR